MEKRSPGRPPKATEWRVLSVRLEPSVIEALDRIIERVYQRDGLSLTRIDLIRQAVRQYIAREGEES
jgi:metal-responsive CopG/Arc/MetJ family transcriptional regulator